MKRTPLRPKREKPRRNEGRVKHNRIKPKASAPPTEEERAHMARVAELPCLVCGKRPVQLHHVSAGPYGGRIARSHQRITPLCERHHQVQFGPTESVEALGHRGFALTYGIDLLAEADKLWAASIRRTMDGEVLCPSVPVASPCEGSRENSAHSDAPSEPTKN